MEATATKSQEMEDGEVSLRIERLLAEVRGAVSPLAWRHVDELVTTLVDLYGRALAALVDAVPPEQRAALADDPLLDGVLALHGLHPLPIAARLGRALEALAPQLGRVELVACEGERVRLRAADAPAVPGARQLLERTVQEIAPEVQQIDVEGLREPAAAGPLVQIDLHRSRGAAGE